MRRKFNRHGEIATVLTILTVGLLATGAYVGFRLAAIGADQWNWGEAASACNGGTAFGQCNGQSLGACICCQISRTHNAPDAGFCAPGGIVNSGNHQQMCVSNPWDTSWGCWGPSGTCTNGCLGPPNDTCYPVNNAQNNSPPCVPFPDLTSLAWCYEAGQALDRGDRIACTLGAAPTQPIAPNNCTLDRQSPDVSDICTACLMGTEAEAEPFRQFFRDRGHGECTDRQMINHWCNQGISTQGATECANLKNTTCKTACSEVSPTVPPDAPPPTSPPAGTTVPTVPGSGEDTEYHISGPIHIVYGDKASFEHVTTGDIDVLFCEKATDSGANKCKYPVAIIEDIAPPTASNNSTYTYTSYAITDLTNAIYRVKAEMQLNCSGNADNPNFSSFIESPIQEITAWNGTQPEGTDALLTIDLKGLTTDPCAQTSNRPPGLGSLPLTSLRGSSNNIFAFAIEMVKQGVLNVGAFISQLIRVPGIPPGAQTCDPIKGECNTDILQITVLPTPTRKPVPTL